jgi:hypothetical protein
VYPKKFKGKRPASSTKKNKKPKPRKDGPLWTRPDAEGPLHPDIDRVIAKPFLATIYLDEETESFRFPVPNNMPAMVDGIHTRMLRRFFRGKELPDFWIPGKNAKQLPSSKVDGQRADR